MSSGRSWRSRAPSSSSAQMASIARPIQSGGAISRQSGACARRRAEVARSVASGNCSARMPPAPQAMPQRPMAVSNRAKPLMRETSRGFNRADGTALSALASGAATGQSRSSAGRRISLCSRPFLLQPSGSEQETSMRLGDERESVNVEDRRDGGGGFGFSPGIAGSGIGAVAIVVIGLLLGVDPGTLLQLVAGNGPAETTPASRPAQQPQPQQRAAADDPLKRFVGQVLAETEDTWHAVFRQLGRSYEDPHLVLYSGATQSACGFAQAAVGPFYCPGDHKVYLDLAFFRDMQRKLGAPGDFARAYVIAHEVGHHVQTLLGITARA